MSRVIIIAEAGVNHNGSLELAKELIDVAALAGADYVKFQTFKADKLVTREAKRAEYQQKNQPGESSQYDMLKKLELSEEAHHILFDYAKSKDIKFLSTGFDVESIDFLNSLGIDLFKVPSGEITNKPYLVHISTLNKPVVLSTGMATLEEVGQAIEVLLQKGLKKENLTVLHCNTEYPTPMEDVNLRAMLSMASEFDVSIGYSDHTLGIEVPIAATALGARIIEKHFTLSNEMEGPDHKASLEPKELKDMITGIRNIESAMGGSGLKEPSASEARNKMIARKSIHVKKNLSQGDILTLDDLIMLRPGNGISPMEVDVVVGKSLSCNKMAFDMLKPTDLKSEQ